MRNHRSWQAQSLLEDRSRRPNYERDLWDAAHKLAMVTGNDPEQVGLLAQRFYDLAIVPADLRSCFSIAARITTAHCASLSAVEGWPLDKTPRAKIAATIRVSSIMFTPALCGTTQGSDGAGRMRTWPMQSEGHEGIDEAEALRHPLHPDAWDRFTGPTYLGTLTLS